MTQPLPLPKYHQIYLVLRERLEDGRFAARVPAEMDLVKEFGVARVTVRRALGQLVADGLIERSPGRGTVTLAKDTTHAMRGSPPRQRVHLTGLLENIVNMGLRTAVKVVQFEVLPASEQVARQLEVARNTLVQKAVRVRSTGDGPLSTSRPMCRK